MTVYTNFQVSGNEYVDYKKLRVSRSTGDSNSSSTFSAILDSPYGRHATDFLVGGDVNIYADTNVIYTAGSPYAQWNLNNNGSDTLGNFNGNLVSGTWGSGKLGSCIEFSGLYLGSGYLAVDNGSNFSISGINVTITSWCNPSILNKNSTIFSKYDSSSMREYGFHITSGTSRGYLQFYTYLYPTTNASGVSTINGNGDYIYPGSWYNLALTKNGSYIQLYQNGQLVGSGFSSGTSPTNGSTYIGAVAQSSTRPDRQFRGKIDDVRFYNSCLNQGEINQIYNNGIGTELISINSQQIFNGILEKVRFSGEGTKQEVELSGRDYTLRLQDMTVKPIVYSNTEISDIVKNILSNNEVPDITTSGVQTTGVTLKRIAFNMTPIFDALTQLAQLSSPEGYQFYVDNQNDLHFEPKSSNNSGYTLNNSNMMNCDFDKSRQGMSNIIYVYGDRYLAGAPDEKHSIGSPWGLGSSVVTLQYKPHNTKVSYLGSVLKGSVEGMTITPVSGTDYGISFDDKQVIFYSGTEFPKFPVSGGSVIIAYDRDLPIIKMGQNDLSIQLYGPKELKIQDNSIKDPATAKAILKANLQNADPLNRVDTRVKGWFDLTPGDLITIEQNNFNLNENLNIVQVDYDFNKDSIQNEQIIRLNLGKKFIDITDKIKEYKNRLDKLESQSMTESDVISRLFMTNGSFTLTGSRWNVYARNIAGDNLILDSPIFGILDTYKYAGSPFFYSWILGQNAGRLGIGHLGNNLSSKLLLYSGVN
jgi:hypothetical protein